ncbi:Uncharacterised protein [Enterococcus durans]|uniref:hypothetical protein n=1 Tax=Enterococcus durans TaxID=53345 RepID=UPI000E03C89A|nr:hypothetical protein [Enterococcus durans]STP40018.1 Uncharacterised protein [Enterococcus durans]
MLKIVIGTNEGKVLCISNNEDEIKASMVNYLIDTDQEPTEDFFESRNWGEYDIEVYEYHQPQLNDNQKIVLEFLKNEYNGPIMINPMEVIFALHDELVNGSKIDIVEAYVELSDEDEIQVLQVFSQWMLEKEEAK